MTIEIDFSYAIDGFYHSVNYYRSETPMDPESMPAATATGINGSTYTDTTATKGINYYVRFGSVRSGVEKISSEYRVLAGTAWTPSNLSTLPAIWTNPQNLVVDGSNRISQATNMGTLASTNFTQSADANKPTLSSGAMSFDGNDFLSTSNRAITKNKSKVWFFVISKNIDASADRNLFFQNNSNTGTRVNISYISSTSQLRTGFRVLLSDPLTLLNTSFSTNTEYMYLVSIDISTKTAKAYLDGTNVVDITFTTTGTAFENADSAANPIIGGVTAGTFTGTMRDFICGFDVIPSTNDIDKIFGWAAHNYGLTANLPSGHPYKNNPPVV